ncbi:MAG: hypothetical protein ACJ79U_10590 [Myxococcales bacterium]
MRKRGLVLALLLVTSCRKAPGPPDPNYEQGSRLYQQLYVQKLDDAYGDPQMDTVVGLLEKVDGNSIDKPAADALQDTIKRGRDAYDKARAQREKEQQAAQQAVTGAPNIDPTRVLGLDERADAGAPADPFGPGASISEINAASGGCLVAGEPFQENVTNRAGTVYRLSSSTSCAQRLAGFVGQMVLVTDGRIYRRIPDSEVRQAAATVPDAGTAAARPDAGTPARSAAAAPAAPAAGAADGGPQQYLYVPGGPMPPGMVPETSAPDAGGY